jgi:hypothetical protein
MSREQLINVPPNEVGNIVRSFVLDGANEVLAKKQANGNWTVTAEIPE